MSFDFRQNAANVKAYKHIICGVKQKKNYKNSKEIQTFILNIVTYWYQWMQGIWKNFIQHNTWQQISVELFHTKTPIYEFGFARVLWRTCDAELIRYPERKNQKHHIMEKLFVCSLNEETFFLSFTKLYIYRDLGYTRHSCHPFLPLINYSRSRSGYFIFIRNLNYFSAVIVLQ